MSAEITQWLDPDGGTTTLDVDWDATGRFMPVVQHQEVQVPGQPGTTRKASVHAAHDFSIKLNLVGANEPGVRTSQRQLVALMDPARGEGLLRVTSPLGDVREISCVYSDGLGMEEGPGSSGLQMQQAKVTFHAPWPYWRDPSDIGQTFTIGAAPLFFPIFPMRLTSSAIAVSDTIINTGDVETWPVWTITGPGSAIALRNLTTGVSLTFDTLTLQAGDILTIDTRPSSVSSSGKTALVGASNVFYDIDIASEMWPLQRGSNLISLEMASAVAGQSAMSVNYRRWWLAP